jgi:septum formation protein
MTIPPLVLASTSPRRRQLLEMLGIEAVMRPSLVPEVRIEHERPIPYAERLAQAKALSVEGDLVLAADTIVVLGQDVLEKPADEDDAFRMLLRLSGRTHQVVTAVALSHRRNVRVKTDVTKVTFRALTEPEIMAYIATGEPMDKAGAYGIQGYGAALIDGIDGDFFGVMGLPVRLVLELLREEGFEYLSGNREQGTGNG